MAEADFEQVLEARFVIRKQLEKLCDRKGLSAHAPLFTRLGYVCQGDNPRDGLIIGQHVPWNAGWSGEESYEIRPCRWAGGRRALWSPHQPGDGKPIFAKPHMVRQRRSVAQMLCTVCGEPTHADDRWWFRLGEVRDDFFMTTEAPVHRRCADHALLVCPHLRDAGKARLEPFPSGWQIAAAIVGGPASERDFGIRFPPDGVVGALKFAWPARRIESGGRTFAVMAL